MDHSIEQDKTLKLLLCGFESYRVSKLAFKKVIFSIAAKKMILIINI
jgi:hypothetical protein